MVYIGQARTSPPQEISIFRQGQEDKLPNTQVLKRGEPLFYFQVGLDRFSEIKAVQSHGDGDGDGDLNALFLFRAICGEKVFSLDRGDLIKQYIEDGMNVAYYKENEPPKRNHESEEEAQLNISELVSFIWDKGRYDGKSSLYIAIENKHESAVQELLNRTTKALIEHRNLSVFVNQTIGNIQYIVNKINNPNISRMFETFIENKDIDDIREHQIHSPRVRSCAQQ